MAWTLSGVTISPGDQGDQITLTSNYSIQKILDATSEYISHFGANSERRRLNFAMFENLNGGTGLDTLKTATTSDSDVALVSDQGAQGNYRILSLSASRRQDHANTLPVYSCVAELIKV